MFERGSIIPYITAGDPSVEKTLRFMFAVEEFAGAIELGIPFSDPIADGKTIQESHERALRNGFRLENVFKILSTFKRESETPVVLMTYYNPIFRTGVKEFIARARESGADGILVVDLPVGHSREFLDGARREGIKTVFLAAPNTPDKRLVEIDRAATGFVYLISLYGTTGARKELPESVFEFVKRARMLCSNRLAVGFGVSRRGHVEELLDVGADGVIVGSALIRIITEKEKPIEALKEKMKELAGLI
ncbi:tryptophan synthase subunit alpha [Thermococcus sp.]